MIAKSPSSKTRGETEMQAEGKKKSQSNNKYRTKIAESWQGPLGWKSAWRTSCDSGQAGEVAGRLLQ